MQPYRPRRLTARNALTPANLARPPLPPPPPPPPPPLTIDSYPRPPPVIAPQSRRHRASPPLDALDALHRRSTYRPGRQQHPRNSRPPRQPLSVAQPLPPPLSSSPSSPSSPETPGTDPTMLTQLVHDPTHLASRRAQLEAVQQLARKLWLSRPATSCGAAARAASMPVYPTRDPRPVHAGPTPPTPPTPPLPTTKGATNHVNHGQCARPSPAPRAASTPLHPTVPGPVHRSTATFVKSEPVSPVSPQDEHGARGRIRKEAARPTSPASVRRKSKSKSVTPSQTAAQTTSLRGRPGRAPSPTRAELGKAVRLAAMKNAEIKRNPKRSNSLSHTLLQRRLWFSLMDKLAEARPPVALPPRARAAIGTRQTVSPSR